MPLPNMKLVIEIEEGQQGEGESRSVGGYMITTRVEVADPTQEPHDHSALPWLALIFVVAIQHELRRAFGEPNTSANYIMPPGARDPVGDIGKAIADRQKTVKAEDGAGDLFPPEI